MTPLPIIATPDDDRADIFRPRQPANDDDAMVARILRDDDLYQLIMQRRMGHELDDHQPHILAAYNKRIAELMG